MCNRGNAAVFAVVCALGASSDVARAQDFPNRPITFVVPYAVGGTVDVQLRALAGTTEKHLGRPFIVENRPSATGTLGPAQVATSAKPDGYLENAYRCPNQDIVAVW